MRTVEHRTGLTAARSHRPRSRALNTVLSELEGIPCVYGSATHGHKRSFDIRQCGPHTLFGLRSVRTFCGSCHGFHNNVFFFCYCYTRHGTSSVNMNIFYRVINTGCLFGINSNISKRRQPPAWVAHMNLARSHHFTLYSYWWWCGNGKTRNSCNDYDFNMRLITKMTL